MVLEVFQENQPQQKSPQFLQHNCHDSINSCHFLNISSRTCKGIQFSEHFAHKPGNFCFGSVHRHSYLPKLRFSNQQSILVFPTWYYCNSTLVTSKCSRLLFRKPCGALWGSSRLREGVGCKADPQLVGDTGLSTGLPSFVPPAGKQKLRQLPATFVRHFLPSGQGAFLLAACVTNPKSSDPLPRGCRNPLRATDGLSHN